MDMTKFRPADASAAAINTALTKALEAQKGIHETVANHKAMRDDLLLEGDAKQLAVAEQALKSSRDTVERVDAIVLQLTSRRAAAERLEAEKRVNDAIAAYAAADAAVVKWWREAGPVIRDMLLEGHRHADARSDAMGSFQADKLTLIHRYPDAEAEFLWPHGDQDSNVTDRDRIIQRWIEGEAYPDDVR